MNSLTQYNAAKDMLRPGDIIMCWSNEPLGRIIEAITAGPSHCAIVRQPMNFTSDVKIVESTIIGERNGVQTNALGARIAGYGPGTIAALRLTDATRAKIDWFRFYQFIGSAESHVRYDIPDLFDFLIRDVPILGARVAQGEKQDAMVCSSWVVAVLESCGVLTGINWTQATPQSILEMRIYASWLALLGSPKLSRFNTV